MSYAKDYANPKITAVYPLTNSASVVVVEPSTDDDKIDVECGIFLITAMAVGDKLSDFRRSKIHIDNKGRAFIRKGKLVIYLDEIQRV